ncbi:MAG TPA: hypothetical protein VGH63_13335, partial [Polyangia bacterium]
DGGCSGPCQQCNAAGHCGAIFGAPVHAGCNQDPHGASECNGTCDGVDLACQYGSGTCKYCIFGSSWFLETGTCSMGSCINTTGTSCGSPINGHGCANDACY